MEIILFTHLVQRVNGVRTLEYNFMKTFGKLFDIRYVYNSTKDLRYIESVKEFATPIINGGQVFNCDICIYSSLEHGIPHPNIKANKYIQIYHLDIHAWKQGDRLPQSRIDKHIAVGRGVQESLKEHYGIESTVIPNILTEPTIEPVLRLVTASRITEHKGFDRLVEMAKLLKTDGRKFIWEVYGEGSFEFLNDLKYKLTNIPDVVFMGNRKDIQSYMAKADYVVQLSDNEGFCYSVHEALQVGVPCIVTDYIGARDVVQDGVNGFVLDMDLGNLDIDRIYNSKPKDVRYVESDAAVKWLGMLNTL